MQVKLSVVEGPHVGREYTFSEHDTFLFGRSPDAHFRLPDDQFFSRMHFMIEINPPLCRVVDLNSHNGTQVNNKSVGPRGVDLRDGDEIRAGTTKLKVRIHGYDGSLQPPVFSEAGITRTLDAPLAGRGGLAANPRGVPDSLGITVGPDRMPQIPGYALQREIGRGGMGVVYLATRNTDKQSVALKTVLPAVSPNQVSLARFLREADIMRQLNHPNIVCCSDAGEVAGLLYFAMEYVEGTNAYLLVRERGQLPIRLATRIAIQLLEGLSFAHTRGFVHRDVKPANVLIAAAPTVSDSVIELVPRPLADTPVVKLTDFGLARTYQASQFSGLTMSGVYGGTPAFMPPEQVTDFRAAKPAADQYSAAATFYYLLTAQTLYDQTEGTPEMLKRVLQSEPINLRQRRPDLPTELALVVHKALARKADQRYSSVDALRTDLLPFAG